MSSTEIGMTPDQRYDAFRRAHAFFHAGRPAYAAWILAPLVEAEPHNLAVLEIYARSLFASAQLHRAEQALRTLVDRAPDDGWARFALARVLERQSRAAEAAGHRRVAAALGVDVPHRLTPVADLPDAECQP